MTIFSNFKKGFTLLETLASISILSLVVIGPLAVTISSSGYARLTKDTIVATYLAEEAVEMLQNQYDSMYVYCRKFAPATDPGGLCDPAGTSDTSLGQTAWRLFKNRLAAGNGQSTTCYLPKGASGNSSYPGNAGGNANGCAFDYIDLLATSTQALNRNDSTASNCKYLVPVSTSTKFYGVENTNGIEYPDGGVQPGWITGTSTSYICSGTPAHIAGGRLQVKEYTRSITIDELPTYETGAQDTQYSDDIRVTSSVQFKGLNGVSHTVKITRYMHARP